MCACGLGWCYCCFRSLFLKLSHFIRIIHFLLFGLIFLKVTRKKKRRKVKKETGGEKKNLLKINIELFSVDSIASSSSQNEFNFFFSKKYLVPRWLLYFSFASFGCCFFSTLLSLALCMYVCVCAVCVSLFPAGTWPLWICSLFCLSLCVCAF